MSEIRLPASLVTLYPGMPRIVELPGETVLDLVERLDHHWPGMRDRLSVPGPALRQHLKVFVDGEMGSIESRVGPGSIVHIIAAVSGGA